MPGVAGAVQLAAGGDGGSALLADGSIRNWGNDLFGQAGNGQVTITPAGCACVAATVPSGLSGARLVTAGGYSRLAALSDGRVMAWGRNNFGQLGSPLGGPELCESEPCSRAPATVNGVSAVQSLAAGEYMSLALLANGTAAAWGYDFLGNLGDGAATGSKPAPVTVSAVTGASDIAAGKATGFAIVGPSEALNVSMAGAGAGSVGGAGILSVSAVLLGPRSAGPGREPASSGGGGLGLRRLFRALSGDRRLPGSPRRRPDRHRDLRASEGDEDHDGQDRTRRGARRASTSRRQERSPATSAS